MQTPKEYKKNLEKGIITKDMLLDCLYSSNKRAKNFRDREREAREDSRYRRMWNRYYYDKYDNAGQAKAKKKMYYAQKETMLSLLKPVCIHQENGGYERRRIYDYEKDYRKFRKNFVWENCYFDNELEREVWFGDVEQIDSPIFRYYLFYDIGGGHTFHTPITDPEKYPNLEVINIGSLETSGQDIGSIIKWAAFAAPFFV